MSANPSGGQTGTDSPTTDSEGSLQLRSGEGIAPESLRLAQDDPAQNEKQTSKDQQNVSKSSPADAKALFQQVREKLLSYTSIQASIEEKVVIGDRRFTVNGSYVQGSSQPATNLKLRLEFRIRLGAAQNTASQGELEQVSDGETLWTRYQIGNSTRVSRRNISQILEAAKARENTEYDVLVTQLGMGGLPALLASIERNMKFESITEKELSGKAFTVIGATWSDEYLKRLPGLIVEKDSDRLPDYMPDSLEIFIEKENLFPRRFLYLKKHLTRDISLPMVDLQLRQVELNKPVDDDVFVFQAPKDVFQNDLTNVFLDLLQQAPQP
ncbi:MAG: hypothetical protein IID46_15510, partial [Planctomycetes bacterium]|nr:hypothetical protein [Planctomycetota bacterium]